MALYNQHGFGFRRTETMFSVQETEGHMRKNSLTLAVAFAALASLSAKAQGTFAYDNTTGYENLVTSQGPVEIGDEINLNTGPATLTDFQFEYNYNGAGSPTGVLRMYDKAANGTPGTLLFQSSAFPVQNGFHQGMVNNLSLSVPGTLVWTVQFSGLGAGENAGLLFYNGVPLTGPGSSFDDHWEFTTETGNAVPHWVLMDTPGGVIDNFGARVTTTAVPEPTTIGLLIGGAALIGAAARRRKA
jgi:hypothetical protein